MKKLLLVLLIAAAFTSCDKSDEDRRLDEQISAKRQEIQRLNSDIARMREEQIAESVRVGEAHYILVLDIRQSSFTLDLGEHMKNAANALQLPIETTKAVYDRYNIGEELKFDDSESGFKWGSFLMEGSIAKMKVIVKDKKIMPND